MYKTNNGKIPKVLNDLSKSDPSTTMSLISFRGPKL